VTTPPATTTTGALATRRGPRLTADPARVVALLFVPGQALSEAHGGRAASVIAHLLALEEDEVASMLAELLDRFGHRHHDLTGTFRHNAERLAHRLDVGVELSEERWLLLGATFTHEYAVEAAALCNPSAVPHPDQTGLPTGSLRFLMSVRGIGEGHRSSIGLRTGLVDGHGGVTVDPPGRFATTASIEGSVLDATVFRYQARRDHDDTESTTWVLDRLADRFTGEELEVLLGQLAAQRDTRRNVAQTVRRLRGLAARTYTARFDPSTELAERVLHPATATEANGMEDARFVRFVEDDQRVTYHATYTAYDGVAIAQQLLTTDDFVHFTSSPLVGAAAANKGLALFPRRIGGRFAALSRSDGVTNALAFSDDLHDWPTGTPLADQAMGWEAIQVGNCGPPIETDEGWLVLTHGVGPMRTYSIGAVLLDLDDPARILGRLREPLLRPSADEQDGYVPNVVYSCGALRHGDVLLIPYGIADAGIGFATASVTELLAAIQADTARAVVR